MRIATYNIQSGACGIDRVIETLSAIDADVLFVQEIERHATRSGGIDQFMLIRERCGFEAAKYAPTMWSSPWPRGRYGIAAFAKDPDAQFRICDLSIEGDRERRFAIEVRFARASLPLVYGTHLSVSDACARSQLLSLVLEAQIRASLLSKDWVIAGDLNLGSREVEETLAQYPPAWSGEDSSEPTFPSLDPKVRIDHILSTRGPGASSTFGGAEASDHLGLFCDLG